MPHNDVPGENNNNNKNKQTNKQILSAFSEWYPIAFALFLSFCFMFKFCFDWSIHFLEFRVWYYGCNVLCLYLSFMVSERVYYNN